MLVSLSLRAVVHGHQVRVDSNTEAIGHGVVEVTLFVLRLIIGRADGFGVAWYNDGKDAIFCPWANYIFIVLVDRVGMHFHQFLLNITPPEPDHHDNYEDNNSGDDDYYSYQVLVRKI